ncbi:MULTISPECIES: hypothetical protein [unclassified Rubrivivax]|uniref:hypothetical protein n=1 Tax=unclassified Rubrivivax TaxID=2649762 RepID=UPI001E59465D|nr:MULTISPECIES: hypothetical protein [unclassified Rubrivivax]MCC9598446.1 hypothetical protein [Rubrivivax sp. JA1055]MCC9648146.1 hypothetical protein [Rubrivivax sp. JA1029]
MNREGSPQPHPAGATHSRWRPWPCGALLLAVLLQGCANCHDARVLRVEPVGAVSPAVTALQPQPYFLNLQLEPEAEIHLSRCPGEPFGTLCMTVLAPEGRRLQLQRAELPYVSEAAPGQAGTLALSEASYQVFCLDKANGERRCSSSEDMPTAGASRVRLYGMAYIGGEHFEVFKYSFAPTSPFVGAADRSGPDFLRLFVKTENWRQYVFVIVGEPFAVADPLVLSLPGLRIDDRLIPLPRVRAAAATEQVCSVRQLM